MLILAWSDCVVLMWKYGYLNIHFILNNVDRTDQKLLWSSSGVIGVKGLEQHSATLGHHYWDIGQRLPWSVLPWNQTVLRQWDSRVVLSEAVDWCICCTRKIQQGGDWERSRPHGPKNVRNFLMTVRLLSWACGHGSEILLILKKLFSTWFVSDIFRYDRPKKCPTILYGVNLWLKPFASRNQTVLRQALLDVCMGSGRLVAPDCVLVGGGGWVVTTRHQKWWQKRLSFLSVRDLCP